MDTGPADDSAKCWQCFSPSRTPSTRDCGKKKNPCGLSWALLRKCPFLITSLYYLSQLMKQTIGALRHASKTSRGEEEASRSKPEHAVKFLLREGQLCWISKGSHKKKQSAFHISIKKPNLAEISGRPPAPTLT